MGRKVMLRAEGVVLGAPGTTYEDIRRAFWNDWAQGDRYWWWLRETFIEPMDMIVEDEDGGLWRMPYSVDNSGGVTFGDLSPVQVEYTPVAASAGMSRETINAAAVAGIVARRGRETVAMSFSSRSESAAGFRPSQEVKGGASVTIEELRQSLGLPENTAEAEVLRVAAERLAGQTGTEEQTTPPEPGQPVETPPATGVAQPETPPAGVEPAVEGEGGVVASAQVVAIDRGVLEQLRAGVAEGQAARQEQIQDQNERALSLAVQQGRIAPASRGAFERLLATDRAGTLTLLTASSEQGGLEPNTIPVDPRGVSQDEEILLGSQGGYPARWLPDVQLRNARIAAIVASGRYPAVMHDSASTEMRDLQGVI